MARNAKGASQKPGSPSAGGTRTSGGGARTPGRGNRPGRADVGPRQARPNIQMSGSLPEVHAHSCRLYLHSPMSLSLT